MSNPGPRGIAYAKIRVRNLRDRIATTQQVYLTSGPNAKLADSRLVKERLALDHKALKRWEKRLAALIAAGGPP